MAASMPMNALSRNTSAADTRLVRVTWCCWCRSFEDRTEPFYTRTGLVQLQTVRLWGRSWGRVAGWPSELGGVETSQRQVWRSVHICQQPGYHKHTGLARGSAQEIKRWRSGRSARMPIWGCSQWLPRSFPLDATRSIERRSGCSCWCQSDRRVGWLWWDVISLSWWVHLSGRCARLQKADEVKQRTLLFWNSEHFLLWLYTLPTGPRGKRN